MAQKVYAEYRMKSLSSRTRCLANILRSSEFLSSSYNNSQHRSWTLDADRPSTTIPPTVFVSVIGQLTRLYSAARSLHFFERILARHPRIQPPVLHHLHELARESNSH